jgi:phage protein D
MLSGGLMKPLLLSRQETDTWSIEGKPRPKYGRVVAKWHDPKTGKTQFEGEDTGGDGPIRSLKNPYKTQAEAKEAAKSEAIKQNRGRGSGSFTRYGMMEATAEVDVIASGYGQGVDGLWRSDQVEQTFTAGSSGGFKTMVNVKAPEAVK